MTNYEKKRTLGRKGREGRKIVKKEKTWTSGEKKRNKGEKRRDK